MTVLRETPLGTLQGNDKGSYEEYLGLRYARAGRFEYAELTGPWEGLCDATQFGAMCPQSRGWYEHPEIPERAFYHKEFREGLHFTYDEDCLNLNIYAPKNGERCPVVLFFYGGGFNSGCSSESAFDGRAYAERGVILVTANYRVGILGYLTHPDILRKYGREGNFGLDDQFSALLWVRRYIQSFGGDPDNITLMGQSAGAISIQYLCLSERCRGLFRHAILMSGAGLFPKFALPRRAENTREYWQAFMALAGTQTLDDLKALSLDDIFRYIEELKAGRKDSTYNTMPVIDGYYLTAPVDQLITAPLPVDYLIGYTNNDMYAVLMSHISRKFAAENNGFVYYFDIDAPGDDHNGAFHSSDLRYVFGTLDRSHRPYAESDYATSAKMIDYFCHFAKTGDPNGKGLPNWTTEPHKVLRISPEGMSMCRPAWFKPLINTLTKGDPK